MSITVTIPQAPEPALMPNRASKQSHWSPRSTARRLFRETAAWYAVQAMPHDWQTITGPVRLTLFVQWPKRRRPDLDAAVSAVKAACDGLADAGVYADDKQIVEICARHEYSTDPTGFTRLTIDEVLT